MKIKLSVDRFENDKVVLKTDKETINFPKSFLPENTKEGSDIYLSISLSGDTNEQDKVKNILNELLGS